MGEESDEPLRSIVPGYSVRVSARAKRARLVMTLHGLEVVVPLGFSRRRIPELVESKRAWIERTAERMEARSRRIAQDALRLPEVVKLASVNEYWGVEYRPTDAAGRPGAKAYERPGWKLVVVGDVNDRDACREALRRWLSGRAKIELPDRLARLARQSGLDEYERVGIRQQRTRWGSCSRNGTISLNAKLLLLPSALVDYVILHELCHTVEMSHSARFWALLEKHDPDYREHKKLVREAAEAMPAWLDRRPERKVV